MCSARQTFLKKRSSRLRVSSGTQSRFTDEQTHDESHLGRTVVYTTTPTRLTGARRDSIRVFTDEAGTTALVKSVLPGTRADKTFT